MRKTALLVIDFQNDFMPLPNSPLGVPGAIEDVERTIKFIKNINPTTIFSSLDTHYNLDISHPSWWTKSNGDFVDPFTLITSQDVLDGKYVPRVDPVGSLKYVQALEANGEFLHFIWPEHCLKGSEGQALYKPYFEALCEWQSENLKWVNFIDKGVHPFTEHFGIFRANVPNNDTTTQVNQGIFQTLNNHDQIYLVGEAQTHCVANSLKQLLEIAPQLASKIVVLEDCMSKIPGLQDDFYVSVDKIYADAKNQGVQFTNHNNV